MRMHDAIECAPPCRTLTPPTPLNTGHFPIRMTADEVAALGPGLASLMSTVQLEAASLLLASIMASTATQNAMPISCVRQTFTNHLQRCIRMPAGGAHAGGSQQTGFELELVSACALSEMFQQWPNHETSTTGHRQSWELRNMEDLAEHLALHLKPAGWGALQGKPMPLLPRVETHRGVILVGPPFTVTWVQRPDSTTVLSARFPLVLWSETDAVILPPDDASGLPFYADPAGHPGLHRDLFKTWGRRVAAELLTRGFPMSAAVRLHLPHEYLSSSDSEIEWEPTPSEEAGSP